MKKTIEEQQLSFAGTEEAAILGRLTDRVERAVSMIQELRREREELRSRVTDLEAQVRDYEETANRLGGLEEETDRFRRERGEIRGRIESILSTLETLETADEE